MRIGIIGPIGAGKSLLSAKLAEHYGSKLVIEPVAGSPFLPIYYSDIPRTCFVAQNYFYAELFLLLWPERNNDNLVTDSTLFSNLVFSELLHQQKSMNEQQLSLVYDIAEGYLKRIRPNDLEIVICRSKDDLFNNVRNRDRDVEKGQEDYLNFHYDHYYPIVRKIFNYYGIDEKRVLYLEPGDMKNGENWAKIIEQIENKMAT